MGVEWDFKTEVAKAPESSFERMAKRSFALYEKLKHQTPGWEEDIVIINDKIFINDPWTRCEPGNGDGVTIIPRDGSYIRYIGPRWYDGQDPDSI